MKSYLSDNLVYLMSVYELSGVELSAKTGVSPGTLHKLKVGDIKNPTIDTLFPIAKTFNVTVDELCFVNIALLKRNNKKEIMLPIIVLQDIEVYPDCNVIDYLIYSVDNRSVIAVKIQENGTIFPYGSIILVEFNQNYGNYDYLVVKHLETGVYSIKKLFFDDQYYLSSIKIGLENKIFEISDYSVVGVVIYKIECYEKLGLLDA